MRCISDEMHQRCSRTPILAFGVLAMVFTGVPVPGAAVTEIGPNDLHPMPGELVLTERQRAEALAQMPPAEQEVRAREWGSAGVLPVAYAQAFARVEYAADGSLVLIPVGCYSNDPGAPNFRIGSLTSQCSSSGDGERYDLYISIGIVRHACSGCYEWAINTWARLARMERARSVQQRGRVVWGSLGGWLVPVLRHAHRRVHAGYDRDSKAARHLPFRCRP